MGGQTLEVVQEGLTCQFDLRPDSLKLDADGGTGSFAVEGPIGCNWTPTVSDDWITITDGGNRTANGSVNFRIPRNTGAHREGSISVGGQVFTILQEAPECRFQLSATNRPFGGAGGTGTVTVTGPRSCAWTASANVPWISVTDGTSGSGNGTVRFGVQANPGAARNGVLTIGSQRLTVAQLQAECSDSISPAGQTFTAAGGQGTVTISTNSLCTWTTSDVPSWVTGIPPSGTGTQVISFTVERNQGPDRSAAIILGSQSFAVSQTDGCTISLTPGSHNPSAGGGASSLAVNTASGCGWTTSGVPAWITGVPSSGAGPQTINFNVAANTGVARSANILIGGRTFAVSQASGCTISLSPESYDASAIGGANSFTVNTAAGCEWTSSDVPSWITGIPAGGTSSTLIEFTVDANPSSLSRSATITIGGRTFTVEQAGAACTYSLSSTSYSASSSRESMKLSVNTKADCGWTTSGVPSWVGGIPASGTGPTTFTVTVASNTSSSSRTARITIAGRTFTVTQAGEP